MKRYVEFPLTSGGIIVVEVDEDVPEHGVERAMRPGEIAERATETFEAALSKVRPAAAATIAELLDLADAPDEIGIEFGVKLNGKLGAVVASAEAEANYKVTLVWKRSAT